MKKRCLDFMHASVFLLLAGCSSAQEETSANHVQEKFLAYAEPFVEADIEGACARQKGDKTVADKDAKNARLAVRQHGENAMVSGGLGVSLRAGHVQRFYADRLKDAALALVRCESAARGRVLAKIQREKLRFARGETPAVPWLIDNAAADIAPRQRFLAGPE